jgi:hypothetical protein
MADGFIVQVREGQRAYKDVWEITLYYDGVGITLRPAVTDHKRAEAIAQFLTRELGPEYNLEKKYYENLLRREVND